MLQAQVSSPIKNDFYETATNILSDFDICYSMKEIKDMKIGVFKSIVKKKCIKTSFEYLVKKQMAGRKGKYIKYLRLTIADYLLPEADMSLEDQQELFSIRCRTNPMGANRGKIEYCFTQCGEILNNSHIFQCKVMNKIEDKYEIEKILNGFNSEMKQHLIKWRENMTKLNSYKSSGTS